MQEILLSDIFMKNDIIAECVGVLTKDDFTAQNGVIYETMCQLYKENIPIDATTIVGKLGAKVNSIGGVKYLIRVQQASPGPAAYKHHIKQVKTESDRQKLIRACDEAIKEAQSDGDPQEIIGKLESQFIKTGTIGKTVSLAQLMEMTLDTIQEGYNNGGQIPGIPTGFTALDNATGGFNRGDLMIVAARPSMGKTALILNMMNNIPKEHNGMIFEMEMSEAKLGARLMSSNVGLNPQKLSRGAVRDADFDPIIKTVGRMGSKNNLFFDCRAGLTVSQIRAEAKKIKLKHGLSVIFIDHIGIMQPDNPRASRNDQIGVISRELKAIAKDLDVCVVALSQLNRGVEGRTDKQPSLSDLRDSGNLEQDSDQVLLLYRDDYYKDENDPISSFEIIIAKNRDGECGKVLLQYVTETQLIYE